MATAAIASGYSFPPGSRPRKSTRSRIEAAEPKLDCAILARLPDKQIILGVLDLGAKAVGDAGARGGAHPAARSPAWRRSG